MRHRYPFLALAAVLALAVGLIALPACTRRHEVETSWPTVTSERVTKPAPDAAVWPLTGLPAPNDEAILRRIIDVRFENRRAARPQKGLQDADIVYETLAEDGATRYDALFQSAVPEVAGPLSGAGLVDRYIPKQWNAVFVHAGGDPSSVGRLAVAGVQDLDAPKGSGGFFRDDRKRAPHDLYARLGEVRKDAEKRFPGPQDIERLAFSASVEGTHTAVGEIAVPFSPQTVSGWRYDRKNRSYVRSISGKVQSDADTDQPHTARNVVVLWAKTNVVFDKDATGSKHLDIILAGTGKASLFRDGVMLNGMWQAKADGQPTLRGPDGTRLELAPGNTWIEVVSTSTNITMR